MNERHQYDREYFSRRFSPILRENDFDTYNSPPPTGRKRQYITEGELETIMIYRRKYYEKVGSMEYDYGS